MSTPYAKLPAWADYGLIPLINLFVAFVVAGFVVLLVGENPFRAAVILVEGAFGKGTGIAFTLFYATTFIFTGLVGGGGGALRPVQHRHRGAGLYRRPRHRHRLSFLRQRAAMVADISAGHRRFGGRGRVVGAYPRLSAGQARLAHRHHHHHVQLHRRLDHGLPAGRAR